MLSSCAYHEQTEVTNDIVDYNNDGCKITTQGSRFKITRIVSKSESRQNDATIFPFRLNIPSYPT